VTLRCNISYKKYFEATYIRGLLLFHIILLKHSGLENVGFKKINKSRHQRDDDHADEFRSKGDDFLEPDGESCAPAPLARAGFQSLRTRGKRETGCGWLDMEISSYPMFRWLLLDHQN